MAFTFGADPYGAAIASYRQEFEAAIGAKIERGLAAAAFVLQRELKAAVGIPVVKVVRRRQRATAAGPKGSEYREVTERSKPGEPPRADTTFGQTNIIIWDGGNKPIPTKRVGIRVNAVYMAYLEFGTTHIAPRPWLLATLEAKQEEIARAFAVGSGAA